MITVTEVVKDIVKHSPFLEEGLSRNLINLSSLARQIQPEVRKKLLKDIELGAIVMSLKRLTNVLKENDLKSKKITDLVSDLTVRSNLIEFTYSNSPVLIDKITLFMHTLEKDKNYFITFSQGVYETTIFASSSLEEKIEEVFKGEALKAKFKDLSSITLILPPESVYLPGAYYSILKKLAWHGISFVEVISSFTELTIFLEKQNVDQAFSVLKN